ncbi:MAG TPA: glycosyl hydrolase 108 family protein [Acetobacteraceae bacterium]|nr:glycosyl hydrolase 108 family protein [Acetobacteraceae bacterium]
MSLFEQVFGVVIGEEGSYSTDPADPGNWTGGAPGKGVCRGTKYGISAAAHPDTDIAQLTLADAEAIYQQEYWQPIAGDSLPPALALLAFDAAVNCGVSRAARWLQLACGATPDGIVGPVTLAAIRAQAGKGAALCTEFQAQRLTFMAALPTWSQFGLGWARRLCALPYEAMQISTE